MTETHKVGEGPTTTTEAMRLHITEGFETAAAIAAQVGADEAAAERSLAPGWPAPETSVPQDVTAQDLGVNEVPSPEDQKENGAPAPAVQKLVGWDALQKFILQTGDAPMFYDVIQQAECSVVWYFGDGNVEPDPNLYGIFNGAESATQDAIIRYVFERHPCAEALFIKLRERGLFPFHTFEQLDPVQRACLEFIVRLVPVAQEVLGVLEAEAKRRAPPPEPPPAVLVPIEETSLEEMPGLDDLMER